MSQNNNIVNDNASTKKPVDNYKPLSWAEVFASDQLPPLPTQLPRLVAKTVAPTPPLLKGTVAQAVPVAYSIYPRHLRFVYTDKRTRELRMNCLLVAPEGGGKECITQPVNHILADIKEHDKVDRARLKEYNDEYARKASTKEKPQRPTDLDIRCLHADITRPRLNQAVEDSDGTFLFLKLNELEEWSRVEGCSGRACSFSVMKLADDEGNEFGQDRVGAQSVNASGCLRLNWLADTTLPRLKKVFGYIHGEGPISRITFGSIPKVEIGAPIPVYGQYDAKYDESIRPFIENLKKATGTVVCKQAQRLVEQLKAEIDEFTSLAQDRILDSLSHRALVAAFRKACLIYAANGMKWEKSIEYYCRWSMQIDLFLKYRLFADDIREATAGVRMTKCGPQSLLDKIPVNEQGTFSFDDALRIHTAQGQEPDAKKVRNLLSQWQHRGYVETTPDGRYKRVARR